MQPIYEAGHDYPTRERCRHGHYTDENSCIDCANETIETLTKSLGESYGRMKSAERIAASMERQRDEALAEILKLKGTK